MTELFQTILLRVTLAGIAAAAALRIAGGGALREAVRLAAGLLMLLALLQPLAGLRLPAWDGLGVSVPDADALGQQNAQTAMSTVAGAIADALALRAEEQGLHASFRVTMTTDADGLLQIDRVAIHYGAADADRLQELQTLVAEECGVPADRQELIAE